MRSTHVAVLRHNDRTKKKAVIVPPGQSLDFDEGPGSSRRWLDQHLGLDWHLAEFLEIEWPRR